MNRKPEDLPGREESAPWEWTVHGSKGKKGTSPDRAFRFGDFLFVSLQKERS